MARPKTPVSPKVDPEATDKIDFEADITGRTTLRFAAINIEAYTEQNLNDVQTIYSEDFLSPPEAFARTNL